MKTLKNAAVRLTNTIVLAMNGVKPDFSNLKKEPGNYLLEVLGVILVAIIILIIFKGGLETVFNDALANITESIKTLFSSTPTT